MICHKCKRDLPKDSFNWANRKEGRRQTTCRECFSKYNKERYQRNKESIKERIYRYRAENPTKVLASRMKMCERNPTHYNAYKVLEQALIAGQIHKPDHCPICGCSSDKHRIEAHHEDYSKPLDVVWCCTQCHRALDMRRRESEGKSPNGRMRETVMLDLDGREIRKFSSRKEAADFVNRSASSIHQAIKLGTTCAGYRWK